MDSLSFDPMVRLYDESRVVDPVQLDKALGYLEQRAFSFTVKTPEGIHQRVMKQLEEEALVRFGTRESIIAVPNEIRMALVTRP